MCHFATNHSAVRCAGLHTGMLVFSARYAGEGKNNVQGDMSGSLLYFDCHRYLCPLCTLHGPKQRNFIIYHSIDKIVIQNS